MAGLSAPVLAAAFPVLFLYAHNAREVTTSSAVPVLLGALIGSALLTFLLLWVFRSGAQAGLVGTVWVLVFFLYGHFHGAVAGAEVGGVALGSHRVLLPVALAIAAAPLLMVILKRRVSPGFMTYVPLALAVLVAWNLGAIVMVEAGRVSQTAEPNQVEGIAAAPSGHGEFPDIYYIVPDRYPSNSTLKEHFGYDNSGFADFLEEAGFYVADESFANYHQTFLSLASSLNMDYLDRLTQEVGEDSNDRTLVHAMLEDYVVWRVLKEQYGYKFIHFGSWWEPTADNPNADVRINKYPRLFGLVQVSNDFLRLLLRTTLLGPFHGQVLRQDHFLQGEAEDERCRDVRAVSQQHPNNEVEGQCHITLHTFRQLREMPSVEGPKFVFVHLLVPHPPFVFGPDGEVVEPPPFYFWDSLTYEQIEVLKQSKLDQIEFTNKALRESIEHILAESRRPPIIIIQADEGPWTVEYIQDPPDTWSAETLRIRHHIINAYHLPQGGDALLYPSISPVNTFRVVFNHYFGGDLPLLEDRAFRSEAPDRPYAFVEVTDLLKRGE